MRDDEKESKDERNGRLFRAALAGIVGAIANGATDFTPAEYVWAQLHVMEDMDPTFASKNQTDILCALAYYAVKSVGAETAHALIDAAETSTALEDMHNANKKERLD